MSKELTIEHIAPYLPYGLNLKFVSKYDSDRLSRNDIVCLKEISESKVCINGYKTNNSSYLPILRPLYDLNTEQLLKDLGGNSSDAAESWRDYFDSDSQNKDGAILNAPYPIIQYCFEHHYDVFSLIPANLAIDINTLTNGNS